MAFLSYSHQDAAIADWLHESLEQFRVPPRLVGRLTEHGPVPKRLAPIFRDRHELAAASDLGEEIEEAITGSRFLIVLCSPAAARSHWIDEEIACFKRLQGEDRILAVIIDGEPFASDDPGQEADECFPPSLRVHFDSRGRRTTQRAEPIAADLREEGDGRKMGLLKIAAGMLGVGLDDLAQREAQRRHRRLYLITATSIAGMLMTSGLAYTAIQSRDAARDQRREAEGLIGFMLGDLRGKLEPIGRLDALDGVGARALAYFQKQDKTDLSDAALAQRSRALTLMGEVAQLRGDLDGALARYREAMAGSGELVSRSPNDPQRLFDHAQNVFWVGWVARDRGQLDRAEAAMREYRRLAERMIAAEPGNAKWRMERANANANLGIVLLAQRRFGEATRHFSEALQAIEALAAADPANTEYQQSLAESLAWLADARTAEGRIDEAIAQRQRHVRLLDRLVASSEGDVQFRQRLIPAHRALGNLYASRGQLDLALRHMRAAVDQAQRLIPLERDNSKWLEFGAKARLNLAEFLLYSRQDAEAAAQTAAGCKLIDGLLARDRSVAEWRAELRDCNLMRARLALASGATEEALAHAGQAIDAAVAVKGSDTIGDRYELARAHRLMGDVHRQTGDAQSARSAWQAGLSVLPAGIRERPVEMANRAVLLRRLGRQAEAQPIMRQLAAIDYRHPDFRAK